MNKKLVKKNKDRELEWEIIDKENKERDLAIIKYNVSQLSILDRVIYEAKRMYSKLFKS